MTNPKEKAAARANKPSTFAIPPSALLACGRAMKTGADKYGLLNWRKEPIQYGEYFDAIMRHLLESREGVLEDAESGENPLAHVMAGAAILIDAMEKRTLIDNRGPEVIQELTERDIATLAKFKPSSEENENE